MNSKTKGMPKRLWVTPLLSAVMWGACSDGYGLSQAERDIRFAICGAALTLFLLVVLPVLWAWSEEN